MQTLRTLGIACIALMGIALFGSSPRWRLGALVACALTVTMISVLAAKGQK